MLKISRKQRKKTAQKKMLVYSEQFRSVMDEQLNTGKEFKYAVSAANQKHRELLNENPQEAELINRAAKAFINRFIQSIHTKAIEDTALEAEKMKVNRIAKNVL